MTGSRSPSVAPGDTALSAANRVALSRLVEVAEDVFAKTDRRGAVSKPSDTNALPDHADAPWEAAARQYGLPFERLEPDAPALEDLSFEQVRGVIRTGVLRRPDGRVTLAPRRSDLGGLLRLISADRRMIRRVSVTTPARLAAHVRAHYGRHLAADAAFHLRDERPALSAGTLGGSRLLLATGALGLALACLGSAALPGAVQAIAAILIAIALLGWTLLRTCACLQPPRARARILTDDDRLPNYTLIVPLYREARVVPRLIAALRRLDYPAARLQVLLAVEEDDAETLAAVRRHADAAPFELIPVPAIGPRTKPKALNFALAHARGPLVAIYDAEDEPEPDQLRAAAYAFARDGKGRLGCVQARLAIDNARDSWLARQCAAEYGGQFDVLLPMLARLRLPFPLGGTSNHFRLAALESVGGWDPFNVTEDADLGVRLARRGWRMDVIANVTQEEAPARFAAWLRQRTRWYKGWLQTVLVHGRTPVRKLAALRPSEALALAVLLGGGLATALIHPFFLAAFLVRLGGAGDPPASLLAGLVEGIGLATLAAGYGGAALFAAVGMARRGIPGVALVLPLIPVYWLLLSLAAWRAVVQLIRAPSLWEKTEHGLARTSLRAARAVPMRPRLASPFRGSGAILPPPVPAAA